MKRRRNGSGDYAIKPIAESSENARRKVGFLPQELNILKKSYAARALWTCTFVSAVYSSPHKWLLQKNSSKRREGSFFPAFFKQECLFTSIKERAEKPVAVPGTAVQLNQLICALDRNLEATLLGSKQIKNPVGRCYLKQRSQGVLRAISNPSVKHRCSDRFLVIICCCVPGYREKQQAVVKWMLL